MLIARIVAGLAVIVLGAALLTFLVTKDRRWLRFVAQAFRLFLVILLIIFALYALERFFLVL
jgi:hypothetical protein